MCPGLSLSLGSPLPTRGCDRRRGAGIPVYFFCLEVLLHPSPTISFPLIDVSCMSVCNPLFFSFRASFRD